MEEQKQSVGCPAKYQQPLAEPDVEGQFYFVYILISKRNARKKYVGHTTDLASRLDYHNHGKVPSTAKFAPWNIAAYMAVQSLELAISLEKYLKKGSGHAFASKHLLLHS